MNESEYCSREEIDRFIEWLIEVQDSKREKLKDLDEAEKLLEWEYEVHEDFFPGRIRTEDFLTAWNEYIDRYPARNNVMFTWDQFTSLSRRDQDTIVFVWEMEYNDRRPSYIGFVYGEGDAWGDDEAGLWPLADMLDWLLKYSSPKQKELAPNDPLLEEYIRTGKIETCPYCKGREILTYGYGYKTTGSVIFICPKCGAIGHHFGQNSIHRNADQENYRNRDHVWDNL